MLNLYGFAPSTFTQAAQLFCLELGFEYDLKSLDFQSESHACLHPFLKMPVLEHNEKIIYETLAIGFYLNSLALETGKSAHIVPQQKFAHSLMLQWCSTAQDYYYPECVSAELANETKPEKIKQYFAILDRHLQTTPYIVSTEVSLADLMLAPIIEFSYRALTKKEGESQSIIDNSVAVTAWLSAMKERPSCREVFTYE